MKSYAWTIIGLVIALPLLGVDLILGLDLFESFAEELERVERYEIDEFIIPSIIIIVCSLIDFVRLKKDRKAEQEKVAIYKAMVQASDHVLKNCLNQMQLIRHEAEEFQGFNPEAIQLFDQSMREATNQLEALGKLDEINEEKIGKSINIKIFKSSR